MTATDPKLTDALLKAALVRRSAGHNTSAELVEDVLVAVESLPQGQPWVLSVRPLPLRRPLALVLALIVTLALTVALVGGGLIAGGDPSQGAQSWTPVKGVPPLIGLPPDGAAASVPETGELVLRFAARIPALGMEAQQSFLYADGRLIWQRNLEGSESAQAIFGDLQPTTAVIEQRLTPEGVALVRADVMASMAEPGRGGRPGTQPWGGIELVVADRLQAISWTDAALPARLADPGSWLPESAWADRQLRGYVPSRFALCLGPDLELIDLPSASVELLRGRVGSAGPGTPRSIGTCYPVTTDMARDIAATLDAADFLRCDPRSNQNYGTPRHPDEACTYDGISFSEILPDGEILLRGG